MMRTKNGNKKIMTKFNTTKSLAVTLTFSAIFLTQAVFAQKYKTAADTVKLNKEYGEVTLDIAKLNSNLIEQQNKTAGYDSKATSTANDAVTAAQNSKATASTATDGNVGDAKAAMKQARRANNDANDARDAKNNQANNVKKINEINEKIAKKQARLTELAQQKAAILATLPVAATTPQQ
jgi:hypothetical protein